MLTETERQDAIACTVECWRDHMIQKDAARGILRMLKASPLTIEKLEHGLEEAAPPASHSPWETSEFLKKLQQTRSLLARAHGALSPLVLLITPEENSIQRLCSEIEESLR